jgi:hypothetical protein
MNQKKNSIHNDVNCFKQKYIISILIQKKSEENCFLLARIYYSFGINCGFTVKMFFITYIFIFLRKK